MKLSTLNRSDEKEIMLLNIAKSNLDIVANTLSKTSENSRIYNK